MSFKTSILFCCTAMSMGVSLNAEPTLVHFLSGTGSDDTVDWEFRVSGGRRSGEWSTLPVPSNWEMHGFGTYKYWKDWGPEEVPDQTGWYRHRFNAPADWKSRNVDLVLGGVMTDAEVKLNGKLAGAVHRGGFYEFRYDVTELLRFGAENILEVTVQRFSADASVNRAERESDYWLFSGIHRPVWLEVNPVEHVSHVAINARHDGTFTADLELKGTSAGRSIVAQIKTMDGEPVGASFKVAVTKDQKAARLVSRIDGIQPWSAEWPHLYQVEFQLGGPAVIVHTVEKIFGFRTVEIRPGIGFYVNDEPVQLRGVNRHTFWPETGRTTNRSLSEADVKLIKDMNMNAVRMSHYPPESHFLEATDRLGLYVIDELAGWQAAYDTGVGESLVAETVRRDVNHPSILLWANGNEGGWNTDLDDDFALYDPQGRPVIHPWDNFNGLNTSHYETYGCCIGSFFGGSDLFLPTEFLHALYDGGGGASLDDWWKLMEDHPLAVGGFLWAFADEGIVRDDEGGRIDVAGNRAPDGVVGPHREKEGSFFAIKEIWSPVYFPFGEVDRLSPEFSGKLRVENRYDFTNLRDVRFSWRLVDFPGPANGAAGHRVIDEGECLSPDVSPRDVGEINIDLPQSWSERDALILSATDPHGREIYAWTWMIARPQTLAGEFVTSGAGETAIEELGDVLVMQAGETRVSIDRATGQLVDVQRGSETLPLRNGPRILSGDAVLTNLRHFPDGADQVVECAFDGVLQNVQWRLSPGGWLRLNYTFRYPPESQLDYLGVTFDYDESEVTGMRWLGKGPYRVWKNRLKGAEFDVWSKQYNDAITGVRWEYPEFKGFHDDMYWAVLESESQPVTIVFASDDLFLRLFTPAEAPEPRTTFVEFPEGDLSILHGITPIGTKFHPASELGPAGAPNLVRRHGLTASGAVMFHFGALPENQPVF